MRACIMMARRACHGVCVPSLSLVTSCTTWSNVALVLLKLVPRAGRMEAGRTQLVCSAEMWQLARSCCAQTVGAQEATCTR